MAKVTYRKGEGIHHGSWEVWDGLRSMLGIAEKKSNPRESWWQIRGVPGFDPIKYDTRKDAVTALIRFKGRASDLQA